MADMIRVLYVDDEPSLLEMGKLFLEKTGNFSLVTIDSASAALKLLAEEQFDAIISDYQMPDMDGIRFLIEVRTQFGKIPFILFTGKGREEIVIQAINNGADFYLQKGGNPDAQFAELSHQILMIVARRAAEKSFRESENRYRSLVENMHDCVAVYRAVDDGRDFVVLEFNRAAENIEKLKREDVIGRNVTDIFPGIRKFGLFDVLQRVWRTGQPESFPVSFYMDNRISGWRDNFIFKLPSGEVVASYSDETAIKQAEEALRVSEERYLSLFDRSLDCVYIHDLEGNFIDANPAALVLLGYTREEIPRITFGSLIGEDQLGLARETIMSIVENGSHPGLVEYRLLKRNGEYVDIETKGSLILHDERPYAILGIARDITERKQAERALRHLTEFQDSVITNARVWLSVLDESGTILMWNSAAEEISGYRSDEVIGRRGIWKKIYPDKNYRKQITGTITRIIRDRNYLENFETTILTKQGINKVISWNTRGIPDTAGTGSDYIAIGVDITDRNRAEESLRNSERLLSEIVRFLPDATFAIDRNGTVISWNQAMEEMTGITSPQILGRGNYEYALPFYGERRPILIDLILSRREDISDKYSYIEVNGDVLTAETVNATVHGNNVILWGNAAPLYDGAGNVTGAIESIRDITERRQAEVALNTSRMQLEEAMDLAHLANWEFDVATGIFTFNDRFYALYGTTAEIEGGNQMKAEDYARKFVHPDDRSVVVVEINKAIQATDPGYVSQTEHRIVRRNGEVRHIIVRYGIIKDKNGKTIKTHGANQDITERKQAENALELSNRKLGILSGITRHDILNQLTVLMGYLGILKKKQPDPTFDEYFKKISTAAERISSMIRFTREYEAIGAQAPVWQDCRTLVDAAAREVSLGKVVIKNNLPPGAEVFADSLIVKVFYNLTDNAVRHGEKVTTVRFSVEEHIGEHILVCEDDGVGIPAEEKEKIFNRGFGKNSGMGLFLSREILSITGISITETGEPGRGARFEICVPGGMWR